MDRETKNDNTEIILAAYNRRLAQLRVKCFYYSLVQVSSFVLLMNICGKNPPLRQAPKR